VLAKTDFAFTGALGLVMGSLSMYGLHLLSGVTSKGLAVMGVTALTVACLVYFALTFSRELQWVTRNQLEAVARVSRSWWKGVTLQVSLLTLAALMGHELLVPVSGIVAGAGVGGLVKAAEVSLRESRRSALLLRRR